MNSFVFTTTDENKVDLWYNLSAAYYNKFNREKKINSYLKKLNELGYDMTAVPAIP